MAYAYLLIAILSEVLATSMLKASDGFTKLIPSIVTFIGYSVSFYFLSMVLKYIPMGISYAIWSGLGIVLISIVGLLVFKQELDMPGIFGMVLIISGVIVIHLFSGSAKL
mgnify:FL=1|tara:strand:- start:58 stop:387 length:330 start_codon:yes stop_codon:yes gene_type:complete